VRGLSAPVPTPARGPGAIPPRGAASTDAGIGAGTGAGAAAAWL